MLALLTIVVLKLLTSQQNPEIVFSTEKPPSLRGVELPLKTSNLPPTSLKESYSIHKDLPVGSNIHHDWSKGGFKLRTDPEKDNSKNTNSHLELTDPVEAQEPHETIPEKKKEPKEINPIPSHVVEAEETVTIPPQLEIPPLIHLKEEKEKAAPEIKVIEPTQSMTQPFQSIEPTEPIEIMKPPATTEVPAVSAVPEATHPIKEVKEEVEVDIPPPPPHIDAPAVEVQVKATEFATPKSEAVTVEVEKESKETVKVEESVKEEIKSESFQNPISGLSQDANDNLWFWLTASTGVLTNSRNHVSQWSDQTKHQPSFSFSSLPPTRLVQANRFVCFCLFVWICFLFDFLSSSFLFDL